MQIHRLFFAQQIPADDVLSTGWGYRHICNNLAFSRRLQRKRQLRYIYTDFQHLADWRDVPIWYDVILLIWFVLIGLLLSMISLFLIQEIIRREFWRFFILYTLRLRPPPAREAEERIAQVVGAPPIGDNHEQTRHPDPLQIQPMVNG